MLINGLGIGVPYGTSGGGSGGSSSILATSSLYLPLKSTLVPTRGASTPTFTRATTAWDFDNEGKLNLNIPSGAVRFTGARLVRNRIVNSDPSSASWALNNCTVAQTTDPAGGNTAAVVTVTASASNNIHPKSQYSFTGDNRASFYFKPGTAEWCRFLIYDGSGNQARFWFNALTQQLGTVSTGGAGWTAVSAAISNEGSGWFRLQALATITGVTFFQINACDSDNSTSYTTVAGKTLTIAFPQSENVSGQADQTASEYVSVGVLSAPFHGVGVDGCKFFNTNKNGSAISAGTLKGYLAELSRVNNCLWARDLRYLSTNKWYATAQNTGDSEKVTNGTFPTDTSSWTAAGSTLSVAAGRLRVTSSGAAIGMAFQTFNLVIGKSYNIVVDAWFGTGSFRVLVGNGGGSGLMFTSNPTGETVDRQVVASFIATQVAVTVTVIQGTATAGLYAEFDNISVKESAVQITQTTGLDNVANSASRLTAAANDATLLQLLTAATGTRTTSAWIKRISGSGTVSLTRNGGINWTDITSSLVTDTWVPVEVTSDVGANPTVGLKMGTSGDVIDVDCFQDENGSWRTSPILTTTAAVTRNADVLSYASAYDNTVGTSLCSLKSDSLVSTANIYALTGDTNGRMAYLNSGNARTGILAFDGVNTASATGALSINTGVRKRALAWSGANMKCCADTVLGVSSTFDGTLGAGTTLFVGCDAASGSQLSGNISEVHIWTSALTDTQLQQVTT